MLHILHPQRTSQADQHVVVPENAARGTAHIHTGGKHTWGWGGGAGGQGASGLGLMGIEQGAIMPGWTGARGGCSRA